MAHRERRRRIGIGGIAVLLAALAACGKKEPPKAAEPVLAVASPRELFELLRSSDPKLRWRILDVASQQARLIEVNEWQKQLAADPARSEEVRVRLGLARQPWEIALDDLVLAEIAWRIADERRRGVELRLVEERSDALVVERREGTSVTRETIPIVQEEGQWRMRRP